MGTPTLNRTLCLLAFFMTATAWAQTSPLIVVEDRGGDSALPYFQRLRNTNRMPPGALRQVAPPVLPGHPSVVANGRTMPQFDAAMFPLRPGRLQPGSPTRKTVFAPPGAKPFFVLGDDPASRAWLQAWRDTLRESGAAGFVVAAHDAQALESLRQLAPALQLMPAWGDELAARFHLKTYPVLVVPSSKPEHVDRP